MSSGWNGIGIRSVGRTRYRLAQLLCQLTGGVVEAHDLHRTNPNVQHYEDCCAWDCIVRMPAKNGQPHYDAHVYSWCTMGACVKFGISKVGNREDNMWDFEVCANESK